MTRFADPSSEEVYKTGFTGRLPRGQCHKARWLLHLLLAAHDLQDVGVIGRIARWPGKRDRYGVHLHERWFITFTWESLLGATGIKLERRHVNRGTT